MGESRGADDELGVYFDEAYSDNRLVAAAGQDVVGYLVLRNMSGAQFVGFCCRIETQGGQVSAGWSSMIGLWYDGAPLEFELSALSPIPRCGVLPLARICFGIIGDAETRLYVRPLERCDVARALYYTEATVLGEVLGPVTMIAASGSYDVPVAYINPGPTPTEAQSWSAIKRLCAR